GGSSGRPAQGAGGRSAARSLVTAGLGVAAGEAAGAGVVGGLHAVAGQADALLRDVEALARQAGSGADDGAGGASGLADRARDGGDRHERGLGGAAPRVVAGGVRLLGLLAAVLPGLLGVRGRGRSSNSGLPGLGVRDGEAALEGPAAGEGGP